MALARALAASAGLPLWQWLISDGVTPSLPVPHFNVLNGGLHATNELDFQEFMIASVGAPSMAEAVRAGAEVYAALRRELTSRKLFHRAGRRGRVRPRYHCRRAGYRQSVSHRSAETEDTFIADLATGTGCGHLKSGAPARGERVAKYNRLLEISAAQPALGYGMP